MQTQLLTIAYDGTRYAGWQRQDGFDTIQDRLESAFETIFGEPIAVHGAGRTDAGVHALRQCAHARLPKAMHPAVLVRALNGNLPRDIAVRESRVVPASFHARFSAAGKRYGYRFVCAPVRPILAQGFYHWVRTPLDVGAMRAAGRHLIGEHDFASFASNPGYQRKRGTVRRIDHLHLVRRAHGVDLLVQGNSFLYNMVRAIAGTLREVGLGRWPPDRVAEVLRARDRRTAGMTAEAGGLFLVRVLYPPAAMQCEA
jgi:tRNA pseudouridine38-40 synthase